MDSIERISALKSALRERILVIDGAMGTAIQSFDLGPDDFGGLEYEGCNEHLVLTRPDVIEAIHKGHLKAGATSSRPIPSAPRRSCSPNMTWPTKLAA